MDHRHRQTAPNTARCRTGRRAAQPCDPGPQTRPERLTPDKDHYPTSEPT